MKKEVFLERLEALLQDIPKEEKRDAIDYYRDYLEEAGPEKEEEVLAEFQSPEHIAEVIRMELQSEWSGGEFTDRGYNDSRFEEKRTTLSRSGGAEQGEREKEAGFQAGTEDDPFREFRDEETEELQALPELPQPFQSWNRLFFLLSSAASRPDGFFDSHWMPHFLPFPHPEIPGMGHPRFQPEILLLFLVLPVLPHRF